VFSHSQDHIFYQGQNLCPPVSSQPPIMSQLKSVKSLRDLKKIGFIVPSSNTALEPITVAMGSQFANQVSFHFTRLSVTKIDTDPKSASQFDKDKMVAAAELLRDADLDAVLWNGTSGSWNGNDIQAEFALVKELERAMGLPASTSTLAQVEVLKHFWLKRIAIVSPYGDGPARGLVKFYSSQGFEIVKTSQMGETKNVVFGNTPLERIRELIREANSEDAEAIVVACTNWPAALVVEDMERELEKPIYDSVCVTLWKALSLVGAEVRIKGWGMLMEGEGKGK
jgi:maleate isomerase